MKKLSILTGILIAGWLVLFMVMNIGYHLPRGQWTEKDDIEVRYTIPSRSTEV